MSNMAHSVTQRLLNFSKEKNEDFNFVLARYGVERLLYRLTQSEEGGRFVLKGASLFLVWFGHSFRTTRDVDLLGMGSPSIEGLSDFFRTLCKADSTAIDGLTFLADSVQAGRIKEDQEYEGVRVQLRALLGRSRIDLQVDIGFGDAITPAPEKITFPTLLDGPAPVMLAYPPYTSIAEKFHAMVSHDLANSRMKDFYDICVMFRSFKLEPDILAKAIRRTNEGRITGLPTEVPVALTERFWGDALKQDQWNAFVKRSRLTLPMGNLESVILELRGHLWPALAQIGIIIE
jgi:hypothetical protein